jgi:sulfite exporter TauE/SafE
MSESLLLLAETPVVAVLSLGFFLGLKHATEADHLAAVSTVVSERQSLWSSVLVGGLWGLGHTISLIAAGIFVLLLNFQISQNAERLLELCVGLMLTLLGLNVLRKLVKGGILHFHIHEHGGHAHAHPHLHEPSTPNIHHGPGYKPQALLIGMVHGLAGSAALMLLVIPTIHSRPLGLLYLVVFGLGSIGGMMLMSLLVGLPFHLTAMRFDRLNRFLQASAGSLSVLLGLWIVYDKAFAGGPFV